MNLSTKQNWGHYWVVTQERLSVTPCFIHTSIFSEYSVHVTCCKTLRFVFTVTSSSRKTGELRSDERAIQVSFVYPRTCGPRRPTGAQCGAPPHMRQRPRWRCRAKQQIPWLTKRHRRAKRGRNELSFLVRNDVEARVSCGRHAQRGKRDRLVSSKSRTIVGLHCIAAIVVYV